MSGFVSPEIGQQIDRGLRLVGFEASIFTRRDRGQSVIDAAYDPLVQTTPQLPRPEEIEAPQTPQPPMRDELTDEQASRKELAIEIAQSTNAAPETTQQLINTPNRLDTEGQTQSTDLAAETEQTATSQLFEEEPAVSAPDVTAVAPIFKDRAIELVKNAPSQNQFVQHIVLASKVRAEAWITTQTGLTKAVVVPVRVNGNTRYAVVSGPFQNRADSEAYIQGLGISADYWLRTAGSLQRILQGGE